MGLLSPLAELKLSEAANSSSVGPLGSGCLCLRVVRLLVSPNGRCLRRGLVVRVVIVGSDRGRNDAQIDSVPSPAISHNRTQGRRMYCTLKPFFPLNSHLNKCFSVFSSASQGKLSPPSSSPTSNRSLRFLTNREQRRSRLLVPWLCVIQDPFSTSRKRGRHRAMAHVLVRDWLRSGYRIRRMARQLVSPPFEPILSAVDHPIDRIVNLSCPDTVRPAGYRYTIPSKQSSSSTSSYPKPRARRISTHITSSPSSTHTNTRSTPLFPL